MRQLKYDGAQIETVDRALDVTRVGGKFSRVRSIERQYHHSRTVRALVDGKLGHASSAGETREDAMIDRAVEAARIGVPTGLVFPSSVIEALQADPQLAQLTETELRRLTEAMIDGIGRGRPEVVIELEVRQVRETLRLRNTRGGQVDLSRAWLEGEAWVERHAGDSVLVVLDGFASARADDSPFEFARRMARRLRWADRPIKPRPGPHSVILSPSAFASLLRPMLFRLSGAQAFQAGTRSSRRSFDFAHQIGHRVFDPRFSLYDDATLPDRPHSAPVDHEGTPGQRTALIEHGIVNGFYHNLQSAALAGVPGTGNGWRGMLEPPRPTLTNVVIAHGETRLPQMLKGLHQGLFIDLVMSSDGSSGLQGDFARTVALAYWIENGRVAGYVRGVGVAGNLYAALQNIDALGSDGFWAGSIYAPYIQIGGVQLTV